MSREAELTSHDILVTAPVIEIDGERNDMVENLLVKMTMEETMNGLTSMELRFFNTATTDDSGNEFAFEYSDNDILSLGKQIRVLCGDQDDPREIFLGKISGLEMNIEHNQQPELVVLAEDALQKARLKRRTKLFPAQTLNTLIRSLAEDLGIQVSVQGFDNQLDDQLQLNETDLGFLRRLLHRYDGDLQIVGEELQVLPRREVQRDELTLEMGSQLLQIRIIADLAHQVSSVTYSGWDYAAGEAFDVSSNTQIDLGPGQGQTGTEILESTFGNRPEHLAHVNTQNRAEAQELVNTHKSSRARKFLCAHGLALGNPNIRVGTNITITGVGPRFENTYYVVKTNHNYDSEKGYHTQFEAECAYLGA